MKEKISSSRCFLTEQQLAFITCMLPSYPHCTVQQLARMLIDRGIAAMATESR